MSEQQKQRFSEVIGGLVSGVAYARSVADMEAMRIAYCYRQHELLKGMPVPRLRIQRVSISLPIIVSEVIPGTPAVRSPAVEIARTSAEALTVAIVATKREYDDNRELRKEKKTLLSSEEGTILDRLMRIVDSVDGEQAISRFRDQVIVAIDHAYVELSLSEGDNPSDASLRDKVGETVEKELHELFTEYISRYIHERAELNNQELDFERARMTIQQLLDHEYTKDIVQHVRNGAEGSAVKKQTVPPDFYVSVNTGDVRNAGGGPEVVTRLNMVLREEGLEWLTEEHDGKETSRLAPE